MKLSWDEIQANAVAFSKRWKDARNEESETQNFVADFLRVFGVGDPALTGDFEFKVPLSEYDVKINFAYDTFRWNNEAKGKAAVHCIIVGFSMRAKPASIKKAHFVFQLHQRWFSADRR